MVLGLRFIFVIISFFFVLFKVVIFRLIFNFFIFLINLVIFLVVFFIDCLGVMLVRDFISIFVKKKNN